MSPASLAFWMYASLRMVRMCGPRNSDPNALFCYCAGALITSKHVLTAHHCVFKSNDPCSIRDFSSGRSVVIYGRNDFTVEDLKDPGSLNKMPIIGLLVSIKSKFLKLCLRCQEPEVCWS